MGFRGIARKRLHQHLLIFAVRSPGLQRCRRHLSIEHVGLSEDTGNSDSFPDAGQSKRLTETVRRTPQVASSSPLSISQAPCEWNTAHRLRSHAADTMHRGQSINLQRCEHSRKQDLSFQFESTRNYTSLPRSRARFKSILVDKADAGLSMVASCVLLICKTQTESPGDARGSSSRPRNFQSQRIPRRRDARSREFEFR